MDRERAGKRPSGYNLETGRELSMTIHGFSMSLRRTIHLQLRRASVAWLLVVLGNAGCSLERPESPGTPVARRTDGYVSSDACQSCHPGEHASWRRSYHRKMTQLARPETVQAPFDGVAFELSGQRHELSLEDGEFWVSTDGAQRRRVVMTTGAHHFEAYWFETGNGRELALFPFMYKIADQRWLPFNALVLTPPNHPQHARGGEWNEVCIACHSTHGKPRLIEGQPVDT